MSKNHTRLTEFGAAGIELVRLRQERKPLNDARIKKACALLDAIRLQAMAAPTLQPIPTEVVLWDTIIPGFVALRAAARPSTTAIGRAAAAARWIRAPQWPEAQRARLCRRGRQGPRPPPRSGQRSGGATAPR